MSDLEKIEMTAEAAAAVAGLTIALLDLVQDLTEPTNKIELDDLPALIKNAEVRRAVAEKRRREASSPYMDE